MNQQIETNRKPWKFELDELDEKLKATEGKLKKWQDLVRANPELAIELQGRITELEIKYIEKRQRRGAFKATASRRIQSKNG